MESSIVPFLIWFICLGLGAGLIIYALKFSVDDQTNEGFATNIQMNSCPPSTGSYITKDGDTNCCDGDIVSKQCNGNNICTLSPERPGGLPSCSSWMNKSWGDRATRFCPSSMPHYYGPIDRKQGGAEGCSSSQATSDGSAPQDQAKPKCNIYSNQADELAQIDSCLNRKALDAMDAPGTKSIIRTKNIALLAASSIPADGSSLVPVLCYDFTRAAQYLKATQPDIGDRFAKDPCGTVPGTLICGIKCRAANQADLPGRFKPANDQKFGKIQAAKDFKIQFDITIYSFPKELSLIIILTPDKNNIGVMIGFENDYIFARSGISVSAVRGISQVNTRYNVSFEVKDAKQTLTLNSNIATDAADKNRLTGPMDAYGGGILGMKSLDSLIENFSYLTL